MPEGIGTNADMIYENPFFQAGWYETASGLFAKFNDASVNTIQLITKDRPGDFYRIMELLFPDGIVGHRDTEDVTTGLTPHKVSSRERRVIKVNRVLGPLEGTLDMWIKQGMSTDEAYYAFGVFMAKESLKSLFKMGITSATAFLSSVEGLVLSATTKHAKASVLNQGLRLMGGDASNIIAWVMPGVIYNDLIGEAITAARYDEVGGVVYGGAPGTLGRPVVISDCPGLFVDNGEDPDTYYILGLQRGAIIIEESEERRIVRQTITGLPNLIERIQGEDAVNIEVKGAGWLSTAETNPDETALGTSTNWEQINDDHECAGIMIEVLGSETAES